MIFHKFQRSCKSSDDERCWTSLFCEQNPMANDSSVWIRSIHIINSYDIYIYIFNYLDVFTRRTQMSLYSFLLIHPHIISQLGSHPFKKLQDAYCPHVPRPHHENIASKVHLLPTSVQERDGSLPIEIG